MNDKSPSTDMSKLERFDELFVGNPIDIERKFKELLPQASGLKDLSIYLQILSQIALAQAMQGHFDEAHQTLDDAEKRLSSIDDLAKVRILLERGRVFMQSGDIARARPFFMESYELSQKHDFDYHTANAAHMIAMVAESPEEQIAWNRRAIELAEHSSVMKAKQWLGALYNNLGHAYIKAKDYDSALDALSESLAFRKEEGYEPNIRVAKWAIARALRHLDKHQEALNILLPLLEEYEVMLKEDKLDIPHEMLPSIRGLVYEELAMIYETKTKYYAQLAYKDLATDKWFKELESQRLEHLRKICEES